MSQDFLSLLQKEAHKQAALHEKRVLPKQLDWLTSLVGRYPWQMIGVLSGLTAWIVT